MLAKWLSMQPNVMIFDEPTRGIDVGAKSEIYQLMRDLADNGVAVLMISSDMEEVIGVSDPHGGDARRTDQWIPRTQPIQRAQCPSARGW